MAYENIQITHPNFCVGPQTGTFCTVDTSGSSAVLRIKNSSGDLIRSYDFYPNNILDVDSESGSYPYNKVKNVRYVGHVDLAGFVDDMVFYTFERVIDDAQGSSDSCIIRRWHLNTASSRLELYQSFTKNSTSTDLYDCYTFDIETINTTFKTATAANTGTITLTTTSGLEKYDIMILGPSGDVTNQDAMEYVYVHSVSGDDVDIRTLSPGTPTIYEYLENDPITILKYGYLFSNSDTTRDSALYKLDVDDYFSVEDKHESGLYNNVTAAGYNSYLSALSFVKNFNIITIETTSYQPIKSHTLKNTEANKYDYHDIYDLAFKGTSIYRLQSRVAKWDDFGGLSVSTWATYNYVEDTALPYTTSVSLRVRDEAIIVRQHTVDLTITVRDQYGVSLSNKNVQFYHSGDSAAYFTPTNGQTTTDINGQATIQYTAGASYDSVIEFSVRVDGSSIHLGSQYVWDLVYGQAEANFSVAIGLLEQVYAYTATCPVDQVRLALFSDLDDGSTSTKIISYSKFTFPGGHWDESGPPSVTIPIIEQAFIPYLNEIDGVTGLAVPSHITVGQYKMLGYIEEPSPDTLPLVYVDQIVKRSDNLQVSQTYISRHYTYGHTDDTTLNQFVFVQEARPPFWSEKNAVNTDIWLRLRPFAASLDPTTFKIEIKEYSYAGEEEWRDITLEGTLTLFDAGGGLDGLEFQWYPTTFFHTNGTVYVRVEVYDEAPTPNKIYIDYWFRIIPDYKAPYLDNLSPEREEANVAVDTDIIFDILDLDTGVDIDSFEMYVNYKQVYPTITISGATGYHINYTPTTNFNYGQTVSVSVRVQDASDNNNTLIDSWRFYCTNSSAPWFDSEKVVPGRCLRGVDRKHKDINLQVYGQGDGVAVDSIEVYIGGPQRNIIIRPIVYRIS